MLYCLAGVDHSFLTCILYRDETYRVLSFDVHKTRFKYYFSITIVDSTHLSSDPNNNTVDGDNDKSIITWIQQDHENFPYDVYTGESLQYMAFVDGTSHLHQDRVEVKMPSMSSATFTRSGDSKTMVAGYVRHKFLTWDFTNRANLLQYNTDEAQYLYRVDPRDPSSPILPEYYFWGDDKLELFSEYALDDIIAGMQVNEAGTILAIWTETNLVYIYRRNHNPHNRLNRLDWSLRMVINDLENSVGFVFNRGRPRG